MTNINNPPSTGSFRSSVPSASHPVASNRYHLYVGLFCPFAHRVLLTRHLKGLQDALPLSIVRPYPKADGGWRFPPTNEEYPGSTIDHLFGSAFLHEVYFRADAAYSGKYSVPLLWDKVANTAVNNESEDIMRMLNHGFDELVPPASTASTDGSGGDAERQRRLALDLYPAPLRPAIDAINAWLMPELNSGVYRAGFAADQASYDSAVRVVFAALDRLAALLNERSSQPFILGDALTELDVKAYATLVRFDAIYVQHFKCNLYMVRQVPVLNRYLKMLHWKMGWAATVDFTHIKENYSKSHADVNPKGITPLGPLPDVEAWTEEDERWWKKWEDGKGE